MTLDGVPVPLPSGTATIRSALDAARARAAQGGRIIVQADADGVSLVGDALDDTSLHGVAELALMSEEPRSLVREALLEAASALDRVRDAQREAAELIHRGRPEEATARLGEVFGVWEGVKRVVDEGGLVLARPLEQEAGMEALLEGLSERLLSVRRSLETSDWAGLADELAFDLDDEAGRWRDKMVALSGMLA